MKFTKKYQLHNEESHVSTFLRHFLLQQQAGAKTTKQKVHCPQSTFFIMRHTKIMTTRKKYGWPRYKFYFHTCKILFNLCIIGNDTELR